jgi:trimeric autotransporter adhesin
VTALLVSVLLAAAPPQSRAAAELSGRVLFSGLPAPGATVTVTQLQHVESTVSDGDGAFRFQTLADGTWTLRVQMRGFVDVTREVVVPFTGEPLTIALSMRSYAEIVGTASPPPPVPTENVEPPDENAIVDVINGSVVNGAATPFAQPRAFGNNRPRPGAKYSGLLSGVFASSALNARPFSFGAADMPPPSTGEAQVAFSLGGPLRLPRVIRNGPQMFLSVQHGLTRAATAATALMPTLAERRGEFSTFEIPPDRITPQARALLAYYPLPNASTTRGANHLGTIRTKSAADALQFGINTPAGRRVTIGAAVSFQRTHADTIDLFGFRDASEQSALNATANWQRRINTRSSARLRYQFTRSAGTLTPYFANRANVSADAGIEGNSQTPNDWGPPALSFPDIARLGDANYQHTSAITHSAGGDYLFKHGRHDVTIGGDVKRTAVGIAQQADPRGTLSFTGAATGIAFADFLLGIPATSTIGFGNPLEHLAGESFDAYATDDWRMSGVTLNVGARWEYETAFTDTSRVLRGAAHGDGAIEPRLGASWRPLLASSFVIRASYGIYRNLGLYQPLAALLIQQPPFARTFSVQNTAQTPLSLAAPFPAAVAASKTFAADDAFRPGSAQNWAISAQRDLPGSLTVIVGYLGTKGARLTQASLPNTYPPGAENPCPSCRSGYVLLSAGGRSLRNAAQATLRRRLHDGFTATAQYTLAKSTDDAATFSTASISPASLTVAQNWLDFEAERGPSAFDQRHLLTGQVQYTTGEGVTGGTLVDGTWGRIYKDWTVAGQLTTGSGLPFTPMAFVAVNGTGFVGIRPKLTGVPPLPAPRGAYANRDAYATPPPGMWGDAGRNSIRGPGQFGLDASAARVFRVRGRTTLEWRVAAANVLNRVTFSAVNAYVSSPQFAQPTQANPMRRIQMTMRYRF